jgi:rubrerythrin
MHVHWWTQVMQPSTTLGAKDAKAQPPLPLAATPRTVTDADRTGALLAGSTAALLAATALSAQTTTTPVTDLDILNYALTLEQLEANFYTEGLKQLSSADFGRGSFTTGLGNPNGLFGDSVSGDVYGYLLLIRNHEQTHVRTLMRMIQDAGGTPKPACTFRFSYNNVDEFLATAKTLEDTGVSAYAGAINMIKDPKLVTAAATIATVEARHASYIRLITGDSPFPNAFDQAKTMQEILTAAGGFIVNCPAS